jgi:hypothetical protein
VLGVKEDFFRQSTIGKQEVSLIGFNTSRKVNILLYINEERKYWTQSPPTSHGPSRGPTPRSPSNYLEAQQNTLR